ncbi:UbiA family prenyltransferase [Bdellovibrionota bacterium FG-2]
MQTVSFSRLLALRLHVSLTAVLLAFSSAFILQERISPSALAVVFLLCSAIYLFNRISDPREDCINSPSEHSWMIQRRIKILALGVLLPTFLIVTLAWGHGTPALICSLALLGVGLCYSKVPFGRRLKEMTYLKGIVPSAVWAFTTVLLPPLFSEGAAYSIPCIFLFVYLLIGTLEIEVLWDLRDLPGDIQAGVRTLPACLSRSQLLLFFATVGFLVALLVILLVTTKIIPLIFLGLLAHRLGMFLLVSSYLKLPQQKLEAASHYLIGFQFVFTFFQALLTLIVQWKT